MFEARFAFITFALAALLAACPPAKTAVCGNGVVEAGETEATCCQDVGCAYGACSAGKCVMPWEAACAAKSADGCIDAYQCTDANATTPPTYDCATCGCGGSATCAQGEVRVCLGAETLSQNRTGSDVADDLDPNAYAQLFTDLAALQPTSLPDLASTIGKEMRADPRTDVLLLAAPADADVSFVHDFLLAHTNLDASTIAAPALVDVDERGAVDACTAVASASNANGAMLPQHLVVAIVDDDKAAHPTCPYVGSYASCALPLVSDCVVGSGRFAETVIVVDMTAELARLDARLLVRAGFSAPDSIAPLLDQFIAKFETAASLVGDQPGLLVKGKTVGVYASHDDHARFVVIANHNAVPGELQSFRAVWNDAPAESFLVAHGIKPANCSFTFASTEIDLHCVNGTSSLDAAVDPATFAVKSVNTSG